MMTLTVSLAIDAIKFYTKPVVVTEAYSTPINCFSLVACLISEKPRVVLSWFVVGAFRHLHDSSFYYPLKMQSIFVGERCVPTVPMFSNISECLNHKVVKKCKGMVYLILTPLPPQKS